MAKNQVRVLKWLMVAVAVILFSFSNKGFAFQSDCQIPAYSLRQQALNERTRAGEPLTDDELRVANLCLLWDITDDELGNAGSGHPKGSTTVSPLVTSVFFGGTFLYDADDPYEPSMDLLIISGGHTAPGLYAGMGEAGFRDRVHGQPIKSILHTLRQSGSPLEGHIDRTKVPAAMSAGSLGKGPSAAAGMALASKMQDRDNWVEVEIGDSESTEGQIDEAMGFIGQNRLDNIIIWENRNGKGLTGDLSGFTSTDNLMKAQAHNFRVIRLVEGDDPAAIEKTRIHIRNEVQEARAVLQKLQKDLEGADANDADMIRSIKAEIKVVSERIKPTYVQYLTTPGANVPGMSPHGSVQKREKVPAAVAIIQERLKALTGEDFDVAKRDKVMEGFKARVAAGLAHKREAIKEENKRSVAARQEALREKAGSVKEIPAYAPNATIATRIAGGDELVRTMTGNLDVVAIDLEVAPSVMLTPAATAFGWYNTIDNPTGRIVQGGCREANAASMCAGFAACGMIPVVHTFASFIPMLDEPLNTIEKDPTLPVILVGTHGGLATGPDGSTHQDPKSQMKLGASPAIRLIECCDWEEEQFMCGEMMPAIWPLISGETAAAWSIYPSSISDNSFLSAGYHWPARSAFFTSSAKRVAAIIRTAAKIKNTLIILNIYGSLF